MAAPQCVPSPIATPRTALPASEARQTRGEFRAVLQAGRSPAAMRVAPPTLPHAERGSWTLAILQRDTNRIVVSEASIFCRIGQLEPATPPSYRRVEWPQQKHSSLPP